MSRADGPPSNRIYLNDHPPSASHAVAGWFEFDPLLTGCVVANFAVINPLVANFIVINPLVAAHRLTALSAKLIGHLRASQRVP